MIIEQINKSIDYFYSKAGIMPFSCLMRKSLANKIVKEASKTAYLGFILSPLQSIIEYRGIKVLTNDECPEGKIFFFDENKHKEYLAIKGKEENKNDNQNQSRKEDGEIG